MKVEEICIKFFKNNYSFHFFSLFCYVGMILFHGSTVIIIIYEKQYKRRLKNKILHKNKEAKVYMN